MQIPGRVGYQCSNFYRQLIKEGEIKDENYQFDKNGKLVIPAEPEESVLPVEERWQCEA